MPGKPQAPVRAGIEEPETARRYECPSRVTIVCYLLLGNVAWDVTRVVLLEYFPRPAMHATPLPAPLVIVTLAHAAIVAVCAWFMLKGANWARIAFLAAALANVIDLFVTAANTNITTEAGAAAFRLVVLGGILLTARANRFFTGENPDSYRAKTSRPEQGLKRTRQREGRYDY